MVATTAGLRPVGAAAARFTRVLTALVIATLFVPADRAARAALPDRRRRADPARRLVDIVLGGLAAGRRERVQRHHRCKRFFDNLPREIFEAARVDGAGPFRLFWSIVLPMSRPIIGVVSVFAVIATWKDYLWPLLVLRDPDIQPLSVRLPILAPTTDLGMFIAALTISSIIPIALFLHLPAPVPVRRRRERGAEGLALSRAPA